MPPRENGPLGLGRPWWRTSPLQSPGEGRGGELRRGRDGYEARRWDRGRACDRETGLRCSRPAARRARGALAAASSATWPAASLLALGGQDVHQARAARDVALPGLARLLVLLLRRRLGLLLGFRRVDRPLRLCPGRAAAAPVSRGPRCGALPGGGFEGRRLHGSQRALGAARSEPRPAGQRRRGRTFVPSCAPAVGLRDRGAERGPGEGGGAARGGAGRGRTSKGLSDRCALYRSRLGCAASRLPVALLRFIFGGMKVLPFSATSVNPAEVLHLAWRKVPHQRPGPAAGETNPRILLRTSSSPFHGSPSPRLPLALPRGVHCGGMKVLPLSATSWAVRMIIITAGRPCSRGDARAGEEEGEVGAATPSPARRVGSYFYRSTCSLL